MKKLSLILLTSLMAVPLAYGASSQLNLGVVLEQAQQAHQRRQHTQSAASAATPIQVTQPKAMTTPSAGSGLAQALPTNSTSAAGAAAPAKTDPSEKTVQQKVAVIEGKNSNTTEEQTKTLILNSIKNTGKRDYSSRLKDTEKNSFFLDHFKKFNQEELKKALTLRPYCQSNTEIQESKALLKQITLALNQNILSHGHYRSTTTTAHKRSDIFGKHTDPCAIETESGSSRPAVGSSILDGYPLSLDQIADNDLERHRIDTINAALRFLEKLAKPREVQEKNSLELERLKSEIDRLKSVIFSQSSSEARKEGAKRELEKTTREYAGFLGREQAAAQERELKHKLINEMRNQAWNSYWLTSDGVKRFLPVIYTLAREQQQQEAQTKLKALISKLEQEEQQPKVQSVVITTEKRFDRPCTPWFLDLRTKNPKKAILTAESNTDTFYNLSRIGEAPTKLSDVYKERLEPTQETQEYATWKKQREAKLAKIALAAAAAGSTEIVPKQ